MGLRVEEDLGSLDTVIAHFFEVGNREVEKVLIGEQSPGCLVVNVEERLKIRELVRGLNLSRAGVPERDLVAGCKSQQ